MGRKVVAEPEAEGRWRREQKEDVRRQEKGLRTKVKMRDKRGPKDVRMSI